MNDDRDATPAFGCALAAVIAVCVAAIIAASCVRHAARVEGGQHVEETQTSAADTDVAVAGLQPVWGGTPDAPNHRPVEDAGWATRALLPCGYVSDLSRAYIPMSCEQATTVTAVSVCESHEDPDATGAALEKGRLQLHPLHRPAMAKAGLDFGTEYDRVVWSTRMFAASGWTAWTCQP